MYRNLSRKTHTIYRTNTVNSKKKIKDKISRKKFRKEYIICVYLTQCVIHILLTP